MRIIWAISPVSRRDCGGLSAVSDQEYISNRPSKCRSLYHDASVHWLIGHRLVGGSCPISTRRRWKWNRISVPHLVVNVRWIHVPVDQFAATDGAFNRYQRPLASGHWISVSSRRRRGSGFLISWHRLWFLLIPYWLMIPWISYEESSNAVHTSNTVMLKSQL